MSLPMRCRWGPSLIVAPSPRLLSSSRWLRYIAFMAMVNSHERCSRGPYDDRKGDRMPTPDRTSVEDIIRAGRDILESDGLGRLTMQAVADRVGVRAPSLYKRVKSRDDLIRLIAQATLQDLSERLHAVAGSPDARQDPGH